MNAIRGIIQDENEIYINLNDVLEYLLVETKVKKWRTEKHPNNDQKRLIDLGATLQIESIVTVLKKFKTTKTTGE